jgi:hypothetical protein
MIIKIQTISINILNSNYKFLFSIFVYCLIYFCFYLDSNIVFCMKNITTNTIAESKERYVEGLQEETKTLGSFVYRDPSKPIASTFDPAEHYRELMRQSQVAKPVPPSVRETFNDTIYSVPTAEAIPVIEGEAIRQEGLAIQELEKENLRLRLQLADAAKDRMALVPLQEENLRLHAENLRLEQLIEKKIQTTNHLAKRMGDLYHQKRDRTDYYHRTLYAKQDSAELYTTIQELRSAIENLSEYKALLSNRSKPICENKGVQAFSESAIAEAMLKSQPKRLRYFK